MKCAPKCIAASLSMIIVPSVFKPGPRLYFKNLWFCFSLSSPSKAISTVALHCNDCNLRSDLIRFFLQPTNCFGHLVFLAIIAISITLKDYGKYIGAVTAPKTEHHSIEWKVIFNVNKTGQVSFSEFKFAFLLGFYYCTSILWVHCRQILWRNSPLRIFS